MKFARSFALAGAAMLLVGTSATAEVPPLGDVILYDVVYYSDATKSVEVGRNFGVCYGGGWLPVWAGQSALTFGEVTGHYEYQRVGRCDPMGYPILE